MGQWIAKFVGYAVMLLGGWVFGMNGWQALTSDGGYEGRILWLVLGTGLAGFVGGLFYLLSFDGPRSLRTERVRLWGWAGMLISALLPHSLTLLILPLVFLAVPMLPHLRMKDEPSTSG